jgi:hypothetical protein
MVALQYRRRAAECLQILRKTDEPQARSELLAIAMAWTDLAQLAESRVSDDDTRDDSEALVAVKCDPTPANLMALIDGVGEGLRTCFADAYCAALPDRIAELLRSTNTNAA